MRILKRILTPILLTVLVMAGIIAWCAAPAYSPAEFPPYGLTSFGGNEGNALKIPPDELTVVTYNVGYGYGLKGNQAVTVERGEFDRNIGYIVEQIKALRPDIVFLQEVDWNSPRSFGQDLLRHIADRLGMPFASYNVTWNKNFVPWPYWPPKAWFGKVLSGSAVLSRFPFTDEEVTLFPKPKSNPFWYNWFYLDRAVQNAGIKIGEKTWRVWNVHLEAFDPSSRGSQLDELARLASRNANCLIVAGDFNERNTPVLEKLSASTGFASTGFNIDHIFYANRHLTLVDSGHGERGASDHPMVWARFKLQK